MSSETVWLLPCPFCGGGAMFHVVDDEGSQDHGGHFIACRGCNASTGLRFACGDDPKPMLVEEWNRRATAAPAQPDDLARRLAGYVEEYENIGGGVWACVRCRGTGKMGAVEHDSRCIVLEARAAGLLDDGEG